MGLAALSDLLIGLEEIRIGFNEQVRFGSVTGRSLASHQEYEMQEPAFGTVANAMDFSVTSVGSEAYIRSPEGPQRITDWPNVARWDAFALREGLPMLPGITLQGEEGQGDYKVSFMVEGKDHDHEAIIAWVSQHLISIGVTASVIFSGGYLDILPPDVDKGAGLLHVIGKLGLLHEPFIVGAGDSMNDKHLLQAASRAGGLALLPGNAHPALVSWAQRTIPPHRRYMAKRPFAAGVREGVDWALNQ